MNKTTEARLSALEARVTKPAGDTLLDLSRLSLKEVRELDRLKRKIIGGAYPLQNLTDDDLETLRGFLVKAGIGETP